MAVAVAVLGSAAGVDPAELGDVWLRRPVQQQQQRHDDADDEARQRVEHQHAEHCGDGSDEVSPPTRSLASHLR
jgi:hypothetical protein